ncbi:hypothetical protein M378DRAFT_676635 [Amanita muscaria Koide BX008]|uniref:Uncharacterized protein n=1 Tax=Amanita muscaria (strain Koide BX008) TaxID=946122 RepID=A0A0C2X2F7_AMAMK|nr:hypothetical protein M378DRAFT_676635 [Amanita muscaria Koide BX008]
MAFSLDNILAIRTSPDVQLYNMNTRSFISTLSCNGLFASLAFSPDCTHLAGGSGYDMYLWDMQEIDASGPLSQEAASVTAMALSRDCSQLACGFWDGTVELWEISPTK